MINAPIDERIEELKKLMYSYMDDHASYLMQATYYQQKIDECQVLIKYYEGLKDGGQTDVVI